MQTNSIQSRHQLDVAAWFEGNIGLVKTVARSFAPCLPSLHLDYDDLLQAGYVGLAEAITRYDPSKEIAFSTFAVPWILGEITSAVRMDNTTYIPKYRYWLCLRIVRCIGDLQSRGEDATPEHIADALQLPVKYVSTAMKYLPTACVSYTDEDASAALAQSAEDAFFATYQEPDILQEVPALTEAERAALQCRFRFAPYDDGEDLMTYEQIGHALGISTTLAHRHVQRGLKKVREALQP